MINGSTKDSNWAAITAKTKKTANKITMINAPPKFSISLASP